MSNLAQLIFEFPSLWYGWTFLVGAAVGSFLNVVVYRAPRGMSLSHPGSRCPLCKHAIRPWHNVPILGWFLLAGKCRDCRAPISSRYPLVEFINGLVWTLLACATTIQMPLTTHMLDEAGEPLDYQIAWTNIAVWLAQAILSSGLIAAVLIRYDRLRAPFGVTVVSLIAAATAVLTYPDDPYLWVTLVTAVIVIALSPSIPLQDNFDRLLKLTPEQKNSINISLEKRNADRKNRAAKKRG